MSELCRYLDVTYAPGLGRTLTVPSWLMTKRNMKSRKSWTPGPGGVNYDTWLSSSGGHNMWLPHAEVHAPATVEEFHLQHPNAPHTSSTSTPTTSCCL